MPISRVMNNPDGSTPTPPVGGGDVNGTLAVSILGAHAGTAAGPVAQPRHLHFQCTTSSLVNPASPMVATEEAEISSEPSAVIGQAQIGTEQRSEASVIPDGTTEPASEPTRDQRASPVLERGPPGHVSRQRSRDTRHKP